MLTGSRIAFLIPTRDRHAALRRCLPSVVRAASAVGAEVILCDQSTDPFASADARVLHRPDLNGLPAARNELLAATAADVVCFLDDDTIVASDFARVLAAVAASEPGVVAWGPVVEFRPRALRRAHRLLHLGALRDPRRLTARRRDAPTGALFGCAFAVRRAPAAAARFDARRQGYALGEDLDFFRRLPGQKRFVAGLRAVHLRLGERPARWARLRAALAMLVWLAARHGRRQAATPAHLLLAAAAATAAALGATRGAAVAPGRDEAEFSRNPRP